MTEDNEELGVTEDNEELGVTEDNEELGVTEVALCEAERERRERSEDREWEEREEQRKEHRKECEELRRKQLRFQYEMGLGVAESIVNRHLNIADPATRHLLLADKLCLLVDVSVGIVNGAVTDEDIDDDVKVRVTKLGGDLQGQLKELIDWMQEMHALQASISV